MTRCSVTHLGMENRGSTWCGIIVESALWRCAHHAWGYVSSTQIRSLVSGKQTAQYGLAQVPRHHRFWIKCAWVPSNDSLLPLSVSVRRIFLFERPTLCVGHSALGCNNHKANATITEVWLSGNKIGDRGAVALAGAIQALLATVFFRVVHTVCSCGLVSIICHR